MERIRRDRKYSCFQPREMFLNTRRQSKSIFSGLRVDLPFAIAECRLRAFAQHADIIDAAYGSSFATDMFSRTLKGPGNRRVLLVPDRQGAADFSLRRR